VSEQVVQIQTKEGVAPAFRLLYENAQFRIGSEELELVLRKRKQHRTDPQRRTFWNWHGEVASELTLRTRQRWTKDDVHEVIFLPRFMPGIDFIGPEGEQMSRPMRTSDKIKPEGDERTHRQIISDAMNAYLAWIYEMGIEVTVPNPIEWRLK
jgi:hypothetical protein